MVTHRRPYALTPTTVEPIPTLGALFPRGGPVQDPVLTAGAISNVPEAGILVKKIYGNRLVKPVHFKPLGGHVTTRSLPRQNSVNRTRPVQTAHPRSSAPLRVHALKPTKPSLRKADLYHGVCCFSTPHGANRHFKSGGEVFVSAPLWVPPARSSEVFGWCCCRARRNKLE